MLHSNPKSKYSLLLFGTVPYYREDIKFVSGCMPTHSIFLSYLSVRVQSLVRLIEKGNSAGQLKKVKLQTFEQ